MAALPLDRDFLLDRARQYALLMRLDRPIGILLLLWPTLWALWIAAEGVPPVKILLVFVAGVVLMRSAGCVINDYADREFDPKVRRTRNRPIAAGRVSPREALVLFVVLCLLAFALVLTLDPLTIRLALVAVVLAAVYPFMKRYTYLPQVVLGMAFGWAIPMAFSAVSGALPKEAWLLYVINVIWSVIYDTFYAMADREDDLRAGVKSTAILFGEADRLIIGILQGLMVAGLILLGRDLAFGASWWLAVVIVVGLFAWEQYQVRERQAERCFYAFLHNNWAGMTIFAGIFLNYW